MTQGKRAAQASTLDDDSTCDELRSLDVLAAIGGQLGLAARDAGTSTEAARALLDLVLARLHNDLGFDFCWGILTAVAGVEPRYAGKALPDSSVVTPLVRELAQATEGRQVQSWPIANPTSDPPARALAEQTGARVVLGVPLIVRQANRVAGVLVVGARDTRLGAPARLKLLTLIGAQLGTALDYSLTMRRLRESEERARLITEQSSDAMYMLDEEGRFTYLNPQVEQLTGHPVTALLGRHFSAVIAPSSVAVAEEALRRIEQGDTPPRYYELEVLRRDGSTCICEVSAADVIVEGRVVGRFGVARDVSEHQRLVRELARRNRVLETLNVLAILTTRTTDLQELLDEALAHTLAVFDLDRGAIYLLDDERDELLLATQQGYSASFANLIAHIATDADIPRRVLAGIEPVLGTTVAPEGQFLSDVIAAEGLGAYACVALRAQDRAIGVLCVMARNEQTLSAEDSATLAMIGTQLGVAIENARLSAESTAQRASLEVKTAQLSELLTVSAGFAANVEPEELFTTVARATGTALGFGSAHVRALNEHGAMVGIGFYGYTAAQVAVLRQPTPVAFYNRLLDERFRDGDIYYIPHDVNRVEAFGSEWSVVRLTPPTHWQPGQWHPEDALVAPLRARDGTLVGVIFVDEPRDGRVPGHDDLAVLELFARQASLALENASLYARTRHDLRRENALREVIEHIAAELNLDRLLHLIVVDAVELLGADAGSLGLVDETEQVSRIRATHNIPPDALMPEMRPGQGLTGTVLATRQPVLIDDYGQFAAAIRALPYRSCLAVPIWERGRLVGTFFVGSTDPVRQFGSRDVETLELFAKHAALAIGNARLYAETRSHAERLDALRQVIEQISSELDLPALLNRMIVSAVDLLAADAGVIGLYDERTGVARVEALHNLTPDNLDQRFVAGEGLSGRVLARRGPVVLGAEAVQLTAADGRPISAQIGVPIWWQERLIGTFALASCQPDHRFTQADADTLALLARHAAVAIENAGLYSALQERLSQVVGLGAVGAALIEERNLERVLRLIGEQVMRLTNADSSSIALLDPDGGKHPPGQELELAVVTGDVPNIVEGERLPLFGSFSGEAIRTGAPVRSEDARRDARGYQPTLERANVGAVLTVPLQTSERTVGAINVHAPLGRHFGARDIEIMSLFAQQAAVAIENARLYERERELAIAEERNRMAREIHDTLAQGFTGIILQLEVAKSLLGNDPESVDLCGRLETAQQLARTSLSEARRSVWNLRPSPLQGRSLAEALRDHLAEWSRTTGVASSCTIRGTPRPLAADVELTVLRIAQEALNNVRKHAQAQQVDLELALDPDAVRLRVHDDGIGFAGAGHAEDGSGFGLIGMRERAARVNGHLAIASTPGRGTRIDVTVPDLTPLSPTPLGH